MTKEEIRNMVNDAINECIIPVVDEVFDKIEVGNDSLYKEKWENLKNYIKERERSINEDIKLCIEGTNYGTAYICQMRRNELQNTAYEMEYIEKNTKFIERGIE